MPDDGYGTSDTWQVLSTLRSEKHGWGFVVFIEVTIRSVLWMSWSYNPELLVLLPDESFFSLNVLGSESVNGFVFLVFVLKNKIAAQFNISSLVYVIGPVCGHLASCWILWIQIQRKNLMTIIYYYLINLLLFTTLRRIAAAQIESKSHRKKFKPHWQT